MTELKGRSLLTPTDLSKEEFLWLVELADQLRREQRAGGAGRRLSGRNVALIFEKASTRTRSAFEVAAHQEGAHATYLGPDESQFGHKESAKDSARVLGRMFDGIEFRGFAQESADTLGRFAGVPVWNGLTDEWHPTQMLADVRTLLDHVDKPVEAITLAYLGDARNNTARSLLVTGALIGMDVRLAGPAQLQPDEGVLALARDLARASGARVAVTEDPDAAVCGADAVYTDVWVSMGEAPETWDERVRALLPYQVDARLLAATGNPRVRFLHCLPALHDASTEVGRAICERHGLTALEVTDDVFESAASIVFDQAENRLHTIKALMVATIGE